MQISDWGAERLGFILREVGKSRDVAYVYLLNDSGIVTVHSTASFEGMKTTWNPIVRKSGPAVSRIRKGKDGVLVCDIARRFDFPADRNIPHGAMAGGILVLGLRMTAYDQSRQSDLHHAIIMALILVVLGAGLLYFVFVIQNYYLVERALARTKDYTRHIIAHMPAGLLSIDERSAVVSCNRRAISLLGVDESKLRRIDLRDLLDFQETGIHAALERTETVLDREIRYKRPDGDVTWMGVSVTPLKGGDFGTGGAVILIRDLTLIKTLEGRVRHSEKLAAIGRLAATVAHEIRNPLSSVRGFARFLAHSLADRPEYGQYAAVMVKEVDRINGIINNLLAYAKPLETNMQPTVLSVIFRHTLLLIKADARAKNIAIRQHLPHAMPEVTLDADLLTQAILNLLLNALQSLPSGGTMEIGVAMDRGGGGAQLWVEDNGRGISIQNKEKIFDPFFTTREKGTGLGLSIVKNIVDAHNGQITLESPPAGKSIGCRFTIRLPLKGDWTLKDP
jgi:two-component system sensor histidine kinase HydH